MKGINNMKIVEFFRNLFNPKDTINEIPEKALGTIQEQIEEIDQTEDIVESDVITAGVLDALNQVNTPEEEKKVLQILGEQVESIDVPEESIQNAFKKIETKDQISSEQALVFFNGLSDEVKASLIEDYLKNREKPNLKFQERMIQSLEDPNLRNDALEMLSETESKIELDLQKQALHDLEQIYIKMWTPSESENTNPIFHPKDEELNTIIRHTIQCKNSTKKIIEQTIQIIAKQSAHNFYTIGGNILSRFIGIYRPISIDNALRYKDFLTHNIIEEYDKLKETETSDPIIDFTEEDLRKYINDEFEGITKDKPHKNNNKNKNQESKESILKKSSDSLNIEEVRILSEIINTIKELPPNKRLDTLSIINSSIQQFASSEKSKESSDESEQEI